MSYQAPTLTMIPTVWTGDPFVELSQKGGGVEGEYHIGLSNGSLDGRLAGNDRIVFSFDGSDEMDPVNGRGTASLEGDRLILKLIYHMGEDSTFECRRRGA